MTRTTSSCHAAAHAVLLLFMSSALLLRTSHNLGSWRGARTKYQETANLDLNKSSFAGATDSTTTNGLRSSNTSFASSNQTGAFHEEEIALSSSSSTFTTIAVPPPPQPLRDIHMVFIGDSVMRYQYLSLAYRLKHGVWFEDSMWYYHLVNEKSFDDPYHNHTWGEFLFHTHRILQPQEVTCDCHRKAVPWMEQIVENRYYHDPLLNNSLVFLLAYGHSYAMEGRLQPQDIWNQTKDWQTKAFTQFQGSAWRYSDWSDVIRKYVRHLNPQPHHIVMNAGLWPHKFGWDEPPSSSNNTNGKLSKAAENMLQVIEETPEYHYVWRTTTFTRKREGALVGDAFMCERLATCVNVSFSQHVRQDLYWDNNHFLEPFYRVANEELLEELRYLPADYVRMDVSDILEG